MPSLCDAKYQIYPSGGWHFILFVLQRRQGDSVGSELLYNDYVYTKQVYDKSLFPDFRTQTKCACLAFLGGPTTIDPKYVIKLLIPQEVQESGVGPLPFLRTHLTYFSHMVIYGYFSNFWRKFSEKITSRVQGPCPTDVRVSYDS